MSKHTPGPWRIQPTSIKGHYLVAGGDIRGDDGFSLQLAEGNARLIAAAPDLLQALKLAASIIGHPDDAASKLIASVIAKATGNQP